MTCKTSAVAVCWSKASRVSVKSRAFNDRLRRETLQQRDLFLRERPHLSAAGGDVAEQRVLLAQRHHQIGAKTGILGSLPHLAGQRRGQRLHIRRVHVARAAHQLLMRSVAAEWLSYGLCQWFRIAADCDRSEEFAVIKCQPAIGDPTKAVRLLQYRIEYWREIAGRGVDDLRYLGGRGLLLQRLTRLGQEPRVFHRDHRLISESAHEFDLLFCKRLDQLARERDHPNRFAFAE